MKTYLRKKTLSLISFIFLFQVSNLSAFDFDPGVGLVVPLGASVSRSSLTRNSGIDGRNGALTGGAGFEWGVSITPGLYGNFENYLGFSLALDVGYHRDVYSYKESIETTAGNFSAVDTSYVFDTISIGLLPKLNVARFFIGIGGGVKIPISGEEKTKTYNQERGALEDGSAKYNYNALKNKYESGVIPYIKFTLDYLFFFNDETALGLGLYAGYDFGPNFKSDDRFSEKSLGSFDIGGQLSFYFVDN